MSEHFIMRLVGGPYGFSSDDEAGPLPFCDYKVSAGFTWPLDQEILAINGDGTKIPDGKYVKVHQSVTPEDEVPAGEFRAAVYHWRESDAEYSGTGQYL